VRTKNLFAVMLVLLLSVVLPAQMRQPDASLQLANPPQAQPPGTGVGFSLSTGITGAGAMLGPGDLIEVRVFDVPELTQKVRVNSDGKIMLALIGEIDVRNMAPVELEKVVRTRFIDGHFVKDPQVSVFVDEYAGQLAYISGEVNRPGAYPLLRSHRLSDLIAVAGGLSPRAGNAVTITREADATSPIHIDLSQTDEKQTNPEIMPGDSITVSQTGIVYVLGDVQRPGGFLLDRRTSLSVVQAMALAEGTTPTAALSKARLIRTTQGNRQEIPLNLRTILKSQSPDLALQAGDIIFVPGSATRGLGRRSIDTVLATASGVAIYAYRP
jgi:polysaccharide biosynthesis/export protein